MTRRRILKILLNEFSIFQAYQLGSFVHNKLQNKQDTLLMACMRKSMKLIQFLEDSNSLQNIILTVAFPYIILSTTFLNLSHTTWSIINMAENRSFDTGTNISSKMAQKNRRHEFSIHYSSHTYIPHTFYFNDNQRRRHSEMFSMLFWGGEVVHLLIQMGQEWELQMNMINTGCAFQLIILNLLEAELSQFSKEGKQVEISHCHSFCWPFFSMDLCTLQ